MSVPQIFILRFSFFDIQLNKNYFFLILSKSRISIQLPLMAKDNFERKNKT